MKSQIILAGNAMLLDTELKVSLRRYRGVNTRAAI